MSKAKFDNLDKEQRQAVSAYISSINKAKYSRVQYFFWLLSGCEISILKYCPTDYNRQAGIGFTIFVTTLLAFCSGSYAGYYFSHSYLGAIIFGTIWATLIFSIDRSMVVTLKKDPTKEEQSFWIPFITRFILGFLIAFVISIPLELLIFKDSIEIHKSKFKQDKIITLIEGQKKVENLAGKKERKGTLIDQLVQVKQELAAGEPSGDANFDIIKSEYLVANSAYQRIPSKKKGQWSAKLNRYPQITNPAKGIYYRGTLEPKMRGYNTYLNEWKNKLNAEISDLNNKIKKVGIGIDSAEVKVAETGTIIDSVLELHDNSFVFNYMVLSDLARTSRQVLRPVKPVKKQLTAVAKDASNLDSTATPNNLNSINSEELTRMEYVTEYDPEGSKILFLLWLIRIIFIIVEVLPTISKLSTPIGAYDYAIYRKEKDIEAELYDRSEEYLDNQRNIRKLEADSQNELTKVRTDIEKQLHSDLLKEIARAQNDVAMKKIEEFRNSHLGNSDSKV
jgi:hypothetical protein